MQVGGGNLYSFVGDSSTGIYNISAGAIGFESSGKSIGSFRYRLSNGDDNAWLILGTGQAITDQTAQTYMVTISPVSVNTTGANAEAIGFNIGQWAITATDGAANLTRNGQWANIEHDFMQFQQVGGTAIFNDVVSSRFRFAIPKTGVTIVWNKGIDFVVPLASDATGSITNYVAINVPPLTGGSGTNFYGMVFRNTPNGGSIASDVGSNLDLNTIGGSDHIRLRIAGAIVLDAIANTVTIGSSAGTINLGSGAATINLGTGGAGFISIGGVVLAVSGGAVHLNTAGYAGGVVIDNGPLVTVGALQIGTRGAFASGDKYLIADASGHVHVSALGPAS